MLESYSKIIYDRINYITNKNVSITTYWSYKKHYIIIITMKSENKDKIYKKLLWLLKSRYIINVTNKCRYNLKTKLIL
jgi:hypothetical protein